MTPLLSTPLLRTQSDRRLATLAADGHDRAFEAIVERYRRPLQRYLRRLLSEPLAEDVLQASFVRAWQALGSGTEVRDLRPWLYRIAHNQALNTLRAAGSALPAVGEPLPGVSLEVEIERREELREALHGIEALPDRQRAALVAVAVADRTHADVAAELGMSDGALRQLLLRARTTLRAAATGLTPYPLMTWLAGGQEATAARVADVAVGAGSAGVAMKTGAAMLAAGAVVAGGPALRGDPAPHHPKAAPASTHAHRPAAPRRAAAVAAPSATVVRVSHVQRPASVAKAHTSTGSSSGQSGSDNGNATASHRSGSSGAGSGGSGSGESAPTDDHSSSRPPEGSGSGGSSRKGSSGREGSRHSDSETDPGGQPTPVVHDDNAPKSEDPQTITSGSDAPSGDGGGDRRGSGSGHDGSDGHAPGGD
jgi:RNA polymerase sigma factor (sigma-70 family)